MVNSAKNTLLVESDVSDLDDESGQLTKVLVRRQMNQSGNILMIGVEPLSEDDFYTGGPNGISVAWTVGHLACVLDLFTSFVEDSEVVVPRWTHDVFNPLDIGKRTVTKADSVDRATFPKSDILLLFRHAQARAVQALYRFDARLWEQPAPSSQDPDTLPTYGAIWQALGVHTFWHLGELSGCIPRFHGTYSLNTAVHYFHAPPPPKNSGIFAAKMERA